VILFVGWSPDRLVSRKAEIVEPLSLGVHRLRSSWSSADDVWRDAVVFPTVTLKTVSTMSTQLTFVCDVCETSFRDEASLTRHQTQDYEVRIP
jgi:hypothetical protein